MARRVCILRSATMYCKGKVEILKSNVGVQRRAACGAFRGWPDWTSGPQHRRSEPATFEFPQRGITYARFEHRRGLPLAATGEEMVRGIEDVCILRLGESYSVNIQAVPGHFLSLMELFVKYAVLIEGENKIVMRCTA